MIYVNDPKEAIEKLIETYNSVMKVMESNARKSDSDGDRAYGGVVRAVKGKLQEHITEELVKIAWRSMGEEDGKLSIDSKKIRIPIRDAYINKIAVPEVKEFIIKNKLKYYYGLSVDKHVFVNGKLAAGIECKAYTENAMIKRILVDFTLLKTKYPKLKCYLFQLESQLGGDYSDLVQPTFGSKSTHSIMSYFDQVELNVITLLKGERKVERPINKYFKELEYENLIIAHDVLITGLESAIL